MSGKVSLEDKYTLQEGRIYITGLQALVRLPLMQRWADEAQGFSTAGFISGYRGSPLGGYDMLLSQAAKFLKKENIVFRPGINEDLGATAVWGSQQVSMYEAQKFQGVFGLWYGKGPGVDRTGDVFKHANMAGTSALGGVIAVAGDDHASKSSTLPHQSDFAFMDAGIPVLHPADVQEVLDFGLYGWAASRYSGCWMGFKAVSDTMDASSSVYVGPERHPILMPEPLDVSIRWPDAPAEQEARLYTKKLPAVHTFFRANRLDRVCFGSAKASFGIMTTGKSYFDTLQALKLLGLSPEKAAEIGITLYKVALTWPLEPQGLKDFASGLKEIFVIEEKRPLMEQQVRDLLYNQSGQRPVVVGKTDEKDLLLLSSLMDLTPHTIADALVKRLTQAFPGISLKPLRPELLEEYNNPLKVRGPFYCSGCPHNTSTKVPEGSRAMAGIGCHYMVNWIYDGTTTFTQMGGEGVPWIGQAPFTDTPHLFANLGDGTYFHSGTLAIRACVAAKVNLTYKILYNDAVAMTGGQAVDGQLSVATMTRQLRSEGVETIAVVSEDPHQYPVGSDFAPHVTFYHRDDLDKVQKHFRDLPGVTVIIYDQTCAAEKRRRRKRKLMVDPPKRILINEAVCEGCGDCSRVSNCLSVVPKETDFGVKRTIDQSSCNKDYSCVKGFCPSFVNVIDGVLKTKQMPTMDVWALEIPEPLLPSLKEPYSVYVAGVGGTGIVTVGALLAMAAHIEGKGCSTMDMTGLAQKGGAVVSHVRIAQTPEEVDAKRIGPGEANLLLGCDLVVAAMPEALKTIQRDKTYGLINTHHAITGDFLKNKEYTFPQDALETRLSQVIGKSRVDFIPSTELALDLVGDTIASNIFMLGYAFQKGWLPVSLGAFEETLRLNGVDVEKNLSVFRWGRFAAHDRDAFYALVHHPKEEEKPKFMTLEELVAHRSRHLEQYQNEALAQRYKKLVDRVQAVDPEGRLTRIVAEVYAKLLAYKDEYEVARLYTDPSFMQQVKAQFSSYSRLEFNLAPPLLSKVDPETGEAKKKVFGPWMMSAFKVLAKMKGLRGTRLDPFGYFEERKQERRLITVYEGWVEEVLQHLSPERYREACAFLALPLGVKGFGHVKAKALEQMYAQAEKMKPLFKFAKGE